MSPFWKFILTTLRKNSRNSGEIWNQELKFYNQMFFCDTTIPTQAMSWSFCMFYYGSSSELHGFLLFYFLVYFFIQEHVLIKNDLASKLPTNWERSVLLIKLDTLVNKRVLFCSGSTKLTKFIKNVYPRSGVMMQLV